jgi:hypothetical protein
MQTAILYVVITLLMSGVLLGFGLPFLAVAWAAFRFAGGALTDGTRLALAATIGAIGIAPAYDPYKGPLPIWVRLLRGEPVTLVPALVALVVTWLLFIAVVRFFAALSGARPRPRS